MITNQTTCGNNEWLAVPSEVKKIILSDVDLTTLLKCHQVCKNWKNFVPTDLLCLKTYQDERIISPKAFNKFFYQDCISAEEEKEAIRTIPPYLFEMICPIDADKLINTHYIMWKPEKIFGNDFNIENFGSFCLSKYTKFKSGFIHCSDKIEKKHKQKRGESGWVAIYKKELPGSTDLEFKSWPTTSKATLGILPKYYETSLLMGVVARSMIALSAKINLISSKLYFKCKDDDFQSMVGLWTDQKSNKGIILSVERPHVTTKLMGILDLPYTPLHTISLINDNITQILSHLPLNTLKNCFSVSHNWNQLTIDFADQKQKTLHGHVQVIGPKILNSIISKNCISAEEEKLAVSLIPLDLFEIKLKSNGLKIMDFFNYVWIPKNVEGQEFHTTMAKPDWLQKIYNDNQKDKRIYSKLLEQIDRLVRSFYTIQPKPNGYWKFIEK